MNVVGVDPGLRQCGVAIVDANYGKLRSAWLVRAQPNLEDADAWLAMGHQVAVEISASLGVPPVLLAVERQAIRQGGHGDMQTKNPSQILQLAHVVGVIFGQLAAQRVVSPYPQSWQGRRVKGKTPGELARMVLSPDEKEQIHEGSLHSAAHNIDDAIGIAKWAQRKFRFNLL